MNGSLYLFPEDVMAAPDIAETLALLQEREVIGDPLAKDSTKQVFLAGPGFAREVIFAGCSPHLRFAPDHEDDRNFCHVALHGPQAKPLLLTGVHTGKPRCPHCRARLDDWRRLVTGAESPVHCPACGKSAIAAALDWRQQAAVGRVLLELRNVFPGEAVPSDGLMTDLALRTGLLWRHAWNDMSPLP
ncbi:MAG: hypothetical protein D6720_09535 [Gammaproteobacteria bacterium]|nr:MAG: hypothetical protein D6720_09535 [Gammaproteobacteria bacterium]